MRHDVIVLAHGGGGTLSRELVDDVILPEMSNDILCELADAAILDPPPGRLAFTTDTFVVKPLFFRGGDIGRLAVAGTVNDLAVAGAEPKWLSLGLILEEGLAIDDLRRIVGSAAATAREAGVMIACGDTKVVGRGEADGIYINTSGLGFVPKGLALSPSSVQPGDAVVINGALGEHGVAVLSDREGISFETPVSSDVAPLGGLIDGVLKTGARLHVMRDPTRGGIASSLNEIADASGVTIALDEAALPITPEVSAACDMLGLDVLTVANEGKVLFVCPHDEAQRVLSACQAHSTGQMAAIIGTVRERSTVAVVAATAVGGERVVEMPYGESLPRIC